MSLHESFYEIRKLECDLHLSLMVLKIVYQNYTQVIEKRIFELVSHSHKEFGLDAEEIKKLNLVLKHHQQCQAANTDLFTAIYKESFHASGIFKKSAITGTTFFRSEAFNTKIEQLDHNQILLVKESSRSGRIARALRIKLAMAPAESCRIPTISVYFTHSCR